MTSPDVQGVAPRQLSTAQLVGIQVLVVDGDPRVHTGIVQLLSEIHVHVTCVTTQDAVRGLLSREFFSVALVDLDTPGPRAGIATIAEIKAHSPTTMVIALTPRRSFDDAVDAVRAGAIDLVLKAPSSVEYLKDRVREAAGRSVGQREVDVVLEDVREVHDDFLERFLAAERRAMDLADRLAGRDPDRPIPIDGLRVLVIDEVDGLVSALTDAKLPDVTFVHATSGGEGLDRVSSGTFHYVMVADDVHDLPARTVARTVRNQHPELIVLIFRGPAENGYVELVETMATRQLLAPFDDPRQLVDRLDDLAEAWRAKERERRYAQMFRERNYDFLRKYVELKTKIERALRPGPG